MVLLVLVGGVRVRFSVTLVVAIAVCASSQAAYAQQSMDGPPPRLANGTADLSGVWANLRTLEFPTPAMLPWAEAVTKTRAADNFKDNPSAHCLPNGVLRFTAPFKIVHVPTLLLILPDDDLPNVRQVYLDGRGHPADLNPTWAGHAIGRWEGDTLVVERLGFRDEVWIDRFGHPHTDKLRVIERYRRPTFGRLEFESTIDDPGAYPKAWTVKRVATLSLTDDVMEFVCENNLSLQHTVGR
jgi:hypothetical protein